MRNTTIIYKGLEYYVGCTYRTVWQTSKNAHWILADVDVKSGYCKLVKKNKNSCGLLTNIKDLVYIVNDSNLRRISKLQECSTGDYLGCLIGKDHSKLFYKGE